MKKVVFGIVLMVLSGFAWGDWVTICDESFQSADLKVEVYDSENVFIKSWIEPFEIYPSMTIQIRKYEFFYYGAITFKVTFGEDIDTREYIGKINGTTYFSKTDTYKQTIITISNNERPTLNVNMAGYGWPFGNFLHSKSWSWNLSCDTECPAINDYTIEAIDPDNNPIPVNNWYGNGVSLTANFSDSISGINPNSLSYDFLGYSEFSGIFTNGSIIDSPLPPLLREGLNQVDFSGSDNVGNTLTQSIYFGYDNTGPDSVSENSIEYNYLSESIAESDSIMSCFSVISGLNVVWEPVTDKAGDEAGVGTELYQLKYGDDETNYFECYKDESEQDLITQIDEESITITNADWEGHLTVPDRNYISFTGSELSKEAIVEWEYNFSVELNHFNMRIWFADLINNTSDIKQTAIICYKETSNSPWIWITNINETVQLVPEGPLGQTPEAIFDWNFSPKKIKGLKLYLYNLSHSFKPLMASSFGKLNYISQSINFADEPSFHFPEGEMKKLQFRGVDFLGNPGEYTDKEVYNPPDPDCLQIDSIKFDLTKIHLDPETNKLCYPLVINLSADTVFSNPMVKGINIYAYNNDIGLYKVNEEIISLIEWDGTGEYIFTEGELRNSTNSIFEGQELNYFTTLVIAKSDADIDGDDLELKSGIEISGPDVPTEADYNLEYPTLSRISIKTPDWVENTTYQYTAEWIDLYYDAFDNLGSLTNYYFAIGTENDPLAYSSWQLCNPDVYEQGLPGYHIMLSNLENGSNVFTQGMEIVIRAKVVNELGLSSTILSSNPIRIDKSNPSLVFDNNGFANGIDRIYIGMNFLEDIPYTEYKLAAVCIENTDPLVIPEFNGETDFKTIAALDNFYECDVPSLNGNLTDGSSYIVAYELINRAGLSVKGISDSIIIDRIAPEISILSPAILDIDQAIYSDQDHYVFNTNNMEIQYKLSDNSGQAVQISFNAFDPENKSIGIMETNGNVIINGIKNEYGMYQLTCQLEDKAGNNSFYNIYLRYNQPASIEIDLETTPGKPMTLTANISDPDGYGRDQQQYSWNIGSARVLSPPTNLNEKSPLLMFLHANDNDPLTIWPINLEIVDADGLTSIGNGEVVVHNTYEGNLYYNEIWSDTHIITGDVKVSGWIYKTTDNINLTIANDANILIAQKPDDTTDPLTEGYSLTIGNGNRLTVKPGVVISTETDDYFWQGIRLQQGSNTVIGENRPAYPVLIKQAICGVGVENGANTELYNTVFDHNFIGVQTLSTELLIEACDFKNSYYIGVKEDFDPDESNGQPFTELTDSTFGGNNNQEPNYMDYYDSSETRIELGE
ncbi:MAG: hypothetical protein JXR70_06815 [Spirochaetales bacterium]|nr:hypothetical protein [Spirochaetales bacterium]